jgi:hypothetical protein
VAKKRKAPQRLGASLLLARLEGFAKIAVELWAGNQSLPGAMPNQSSKIDRRRKHLVSVSFIDT